MHLVVVGGGFTGLWTALIAKQRDPDRSVTVLESGTVGQGASGSSAGFVDSSLTYSLQNGAELWPDEIRRIDVLGRNNLREIIDTIVQHRISCNLKQPGHLHVARDPRHIDWLHQQYDQYLEYDHDVEWLDRRATAAETGSRSYLGALVRKTGVALVSPPKLIDGLKRVGIELGVEISENCGPVRLRSMATRTSDVVRLRTSHGDVVSDQVALCTGGYRSPLAAVRRVVRPRHSHWILTRPLTNVEFTSRGWPSGKSISECGDEFHYSRLVVQDDQLIRMLYGGGKNVHNAWPASTKRAFDQRPRSFNSLTHELYRTWPELEGTKFERGGGGLIDFSARKHAHYGTAFGGRVVWAAGHSGNGICASRFSAKVMLDLLSGEPTELTSLQMVR